MADPRHEENRTGPEPPLWSIGIAVVVILLAPVLLYSLAPTGPLREGDTIFSHGQQRVIRSTGNSEAVQTGEVCLLDPDHPLIILRKFEDSSSAVMLAQVQGNPSAEWPFCPPRSEVMIGSHQIYQTPNPLAHVRDWLAAWFGH
jgi:hypothetical protein